MPRQIDERREHFSEWPGFRREFPKNLVVTAVCDRRKRRSQSTAMAKSLKLYHYPKVIRRLEIG
jgi:hypothetical protein